MICLLGENGLDQCSQDTAHPSERRQLELLRLEHGAFQECSSATVPLISVTEIRFTIFLLQLSFVEWWLFKAFSCWGWTKAWLFNDSHVASWHLWTQPLLYFAYAIGSAVFSQNLVGMTHTGWIIYIYMWCIFCDILDLPKHPGKLSAVSLQVFLQCEQT